MSIKKILIKAVVFLAGIGSSYAQDCSEDFHGQVFDLHDNHTLADAVITVQETNQNVVSNAQGEFHLTDLCSGNYSLLIRHVECEELLLKISIPFSGTKRIYLEHHVNELEEIIVSDFIQKNTTKTGVEQQIAKEEILRFRTQNLGDAMASLSGVSAIKTGNAIVKPVAHGVSGSRLAIVNEGIRLQDHEWGADHAPSIDINGTSRIQWIKGANALKYGGDALGGVLEILPQKYQRKDSLMGTLTTGYHSQGKGSVVLGELTKTTQGGNYAGIVASLKNAGDLESVDYVLSNTGNKENHLKAFFGRNTITQEWRIDYRFFQKESGILAAAHLGTLGDLARAINSTDPLVIRPWTQSISNPKQETTHHNLAFRYDRRMADQTRWDIRYSYQSNVRKEFDTRRGEYKNQAALDMRLQSHDLQFNVQSRTINNLKWSTGFAAQLQDNFPDPSTGVRRLIPDYLRVKMGVYAVAEYIPSNDFLAEIGLRYDYDAYRAQKYYRISDWEARNYDLRFAHTIQSTTRTGQYLTEQNNSYGNLSGSLGIKQFLGKGNFLLLNLGLLSRSPNPSELFSDGLHHALATIELGELSLQQERAFKGIVAFEKKEGKLQYATSLYWSTVADYIVLEPTTDGFDQTRNSAFLKRKYRQLPQVNLRGIDLDISYDLSSKWRYQGALAWVKANQKNGEDLIDIPPLNLSNQIIIRPFKNNSTEIHLMSDYVAEQSNFPNYNFEYSFLRDGTIMNETIDISTPPKGYHLLGVEFHTSLYKVFNLRLNIDNLLNTDNRNYLNRLRFFAAETGRNIRLELTYSF